MWKLGRDLIAVVAVIGLVLSIVAFRNTQNQADQLASQAETLDTSPQLSLEDGLLTLVDQAGHVSTLDVSGEDITGGATSGSAKLSLAFGAGLEITDEELSLLRTCASGQVLEWDGAEWSCSTPVAGEGESTTVVNEVENDFSTSASHTWSGLQTFSSGINVGGASVTNFTGSGLSLTSGTLGLNIAALTSTNSPDDDYQLVIYDPNSGLHKRITRGDFSIGLGGGGAGTASGVANVPAGNIASNNVQDALNELDTELSTAISSLTTTVSGKYGSGSNATLGTISGSSLTLSGTITINSEQFGDLTGNGLQVSGSALTLVTQANKGLEVDVNGISLIDCTNNQILKYSTTGNQWTCAADVDTDTDTGVTSVGAFSESNHYTNGASITTTTITLGAADATSPGLVTTGTQTFAGAKTFSGQVTLNGGLTIESGDTLAFNGQNFTDLVGDGLQNSAGVLSLQVVANQGIAVDASGLALETCSTGEILKYNTDHWECASDDSGAGTITLGTSTDGNYVATIAAGNGISGSSSVESGTPTIALSNLTGDWTQSGAFDVVLANADSQLQIMESTGDTYYGTLDVGDLSANQNYTFIAGGTVLTTGNIASNATTGVTAGNGLTGGGTVGTLGLALISCSEDEILKADAVSDWICATDAAGASDGGVLSVGTFSGSSIADGASISGTVITFGPADGTNPGMVTTGTQTFAGAKTFSGGLTLDSTLDVTGAVTGGTYNGQDIDATANFTGTLGVTGLTTLSGGLTIENGDTLNFHGENFTDLTGDGLQNSAGVLSVLVRTNQGLEADSSGIGLLSTCTTGQILKYNTDHWECAGDDSGLSSITLGTNTDGNYVATITAGNGISGSSSSEGGTPTIALSNLTSDWSQAGAFDIVLANADSQLQIMESAGDTYYGTFDVGDLSADQSYTFIAGGTVLTTGNISSNATTGVTAGNGLTGGGTTGTLGLALISCSEDEVLKADAVSDWICASDNTGTPDGGVLSVGAFSGSSIADGASISGTVITFGPADGTNPGMVTTGAQTLAGAKTFSNQITASGGVALGTQTLSGGAAVIDFTSFDVASNGNVTAGTYNGQTIGTTTHLTGTIEVDGNTTLDGTLTLSAMSAGDGLLFNDNGVVSELAYGSDGECLIMVTGVPTWTTCPTDGVGVASITGSTGDTLSGAVILANSSSNNGTNTVTIDDASTSAKGIASFSSTNFGVTAGAVSIKTGGVDSTAILDSTIANSDLASGAFSNITGVGTLNGVTATGTASLAILTTSGNVTLGDAAADTITFNAVAASTLNMDGNIITNIGATGTSFTGTGGLTLVDDLAVGGSAGIDATTGNITAGTYNGQDIDATANFTGTLDVAGDTTLAALNATGAVTFDSSVNLGALSNGVVYASAGDGTLASTGVGTEDYCLMADASGLPIWGVCPDTDTITTVEGVSGAITIDNATITGSAVTIDNASTSAKGIASFDSNFFSVTSGAVSLAVGANVDAGNFLFLNIGDAGTDFTATGGLNLADDLAIGSGFTVDAATGSVAVQTSNFTVDGATGDVVIAGTLDVTGELTAGSLVIDGLTIDNTSFESTGLLSLVAGSGQTITLTIGASSILTVSSTGASISGTLAITGHLTAGGDTRGTATVDDSTSTETVNFGTTYSTAPKVVVTPTSDISAYTYYVTSTTTGFTITMSSVVSGNQTFDWVAIE